MRAVYRHVETVEERDPQAVKRIFVLLKLIKLKPGRTISELATAAEITTSKCSVYLADLDAVNYVLLHNDGSCKRVYLAKAGEDAIQKKELFEKVTGRDFTTLLDFAKQKGML